MSYETSREESPQCTLKAFVRYCERAALSMNKRTAIDDAIDKLDALLALVSSAQRAPTGTG